MKTYYYVMLTLLFSMLLFAGCGNDGGAAPTSPTGVTATITAENRLVIDWTPVSGATSYNVYISDVPGVQKNDGPGTIKNAVNPQIYNARVGLILGHTYFFAVTSLNSFGESNLSSEASVQIPHLSF